MIFALLLLLIDSEEEVLDIFNLLDIEKKKIIKKGLEKIYADKFNKEIAMYKKMHRDYEKKRIELSKLYEFSLEQDFIKPSFNLDSDIDFQIATGFQEVDDLMI